MSPLAPTAAHLRFALASLCALLHTGCASLDVGQRYEAPAGPPPEASARVARNFDATWERLVRELSQSFFDVNQISKDSRFIALAVRERDLDGLIDCGRLAYDVNGKPWHFDPAVDADFHEGGGLGETTIAHRTKSRVGKMNIFVAPDGSGTRIEVNATFTLDMAQHGEAVARNLLGDVISRDRFPAADARFRFTTKRSDEQPLGERRVTCRSSGRWENEILAIVR